MTFKELPDGALTRWVNEMTSEQADAALDTWYRYASPKYRDLIDAILSDDLDANVLVANHALLEEDNRDIEFTEEFVNLVQRGRAQSQELLDLISRHTSWYVNEEILVPRIETNLGDVRRSRHSSYRWNPNLGRTGRYIDDNGRMVSNRSVNRQMEKVIMGVQDEMAELSERLVDNDIGVQQWHTEMRKRIKTIHSLGAAIAKGGSAQMSNTDWGRVGAMTKAQYKWLDNFAQEVDTGKQSRSRGLLSRARQYARAARGTKEEILRRLAKVNNTEERRVLGVAEHCTSRGGRTGCIEWAAMKWKPIGTLGRISDSPCLNNCHCRFVFR